MFLGRMLRVWLALLVETECSSPARMGNVIWLATVEVSACCD